MKIFSEKDTDPSLLLKKRIVLFGYGSQGRAQALNARDSGVKFLKIALPESSKSVAQAQSDGFEVLTPAQGAKMAEIAILLTPDETHGSLYQETLAASLPLKASIGFAHGFALHFGEIRLREDLSAFLVAPKGPGYLLRQSYLAHSGLMARIAAWPHPSFQDQAFKNALSWASLIGCARIGLLETDFAQETQSNLFGEQAILCGGTAALLRAGFEIMVENGISPEMAYLESAHSLKIMADLIYAKGLEGANKLISKTAAFGGYVGEEAYKASEIKRVMSELMAEIKSGEFAAKLKREKENAYPLMQERETLAAKETMCKTGQSLREWLLKDDVK